MYGLLIFLSIILSIFIVETRIKKSQLNLEVFWELSFGTILTGIIGARIYHVIDLWEIYSRNPISIFYIWNGGLGIYGALALGFVYLYLYLKKRQQDILLWLDKIVLPIPLAQSIGRWGNYFNNELLPYAIYESFFDLVLFIILVLLDRKKLEKGQLFLTYVLGYAIIRLSLEPIKSDSWELMGLNVAQSISILLILGISYIWYTKTKRKS